MAESLRCDDIDAMGARRSHKLAEYSTVEVLPNQAFPLRRLNAELRDVGVLNNQRWRGANVSSRVPSGPLRRTRASYCGARQVGKG